LHNSANFSNSLGINGFDQDLKTAHNDSDVGAKGGELGPQQVCQFAEQTGDHLLLLERGGALGVCGSRNGNEIAAVGVEVFLNQGHNHLEIKFLAKEKRINLLALTLEKNLMSLVQVLKLFLLLKVLDGLYSFWLMEAVSVYWISFSSRL